MRITLPEVTCKLSKEGYIKNRASETRPYEKYHTPYTEIKFKNGSKQITLDLRFSNLAIKDQFIYKITLTYKVRPYDIKTQNEKYKRYQNIESLNVNIEEIRNHMEMKMYGKKYNFMAGEYKDKLAENIDDDDIELAYQAIEEVGIPALAEAILD